MADFSKKGTVNITCPLGLAETLAKEVKNLGFSIDKKRDSGLEITASLNDCITLNYWLRTAHRVHYLIGQRPIQTPEKLTLWLKTIPWEEWIASDGYFSVTSRIDHKSIENDQFANLIVKDAIVDRIRFKKDERPDSGSNLDKTVVFLYWTNDIARIFIDTSGESLSRRNYRTKSSSAPMQETLAAGIIDKTRWKPGMHFINPMAGSGTLVIEAVMKATNRAPASLRNNFGFMHIEGFQEDVYRQVRNEARQNVIKNPGGTFIATDKDPAAIINAKKNAETAGIAHLIEFETCDFSDTQIPQGDGIVVFNPPYGIRIGSNEDLRPLYKNIGDFMKTSCPGKTGYVFTGNVKLAKKIGLRAAKRTTFFNSTIECRLLEYELYKGSKK